jgi:hypothetical protein
VDPVKSYPLRRWPLSCGGTVPAAPASTRHSWNKFKIPVPPALSVSLPVVEGVYGSPSVKETIEVRTNWML